MTTYLRTATLSFLALTACEQLPTPLHLNKYSAIQDATGAINCITQPSQSGSPQTIYSRKGIDCPNTSDKTLVLTDELEKLFTQTHTHYIALEAYINADLQK